MEEEKEAIMLNVQMDNCNVTSAPAVEHISQVVYVNCNAGRKPAEMSAEMPAAAEPQTANTPQEPAHPHQPEQPKVSADAIRLRNYCDNETSWKKYLDAIPVCKTATELANVVVDMERLQNKLLKDDSTKRCFLDIIVSLATGIESGRTVDNVRQRIYTAHSREIAPNGLWVTIQHPNISLMYKSLLDGDRPKCNTPEERAILRYVEELVSPDFTPIQFGSS